MKLTGEVHGTKLTWKAMFGEGFRTDLPHTAV